MRIINVVKCEFIKNYTLKKILPSLIFLLLSVIAVAEYPMINRMDSNESNVPYLEENYNKTKLELEQNPTLENEFYFEYWKNDLEYKRKKEKLNKENWKKECLYTISNLQNKIFVLNQMINNPESSFQEKENYSNFAQIQYGNIIKEIKEETKSLEELKQTYEEKLVTYQTLLEGDEYYKYIEYLLENQSFIESLTPSIIYELVGNEMVEIAEPEKYEKYYQMIVDLKIKSPEDYRVENIFLRMQLDMDTSILSEDDFIKSGENTHYVSYNHYLKQKKELVRLDKKYKAILDYSIEHQKKNDIVLYGSSDSFELDVQMNSKRMANQVLLLGIVVLLITIITSSGIISNEHLMKTDKMLLTSSVKRSKVIIGKFFYLIFHMYFLWLVAFLFILLYAGVRLGFTDLFTSKLVYFNSNVVEVNYILYMIYKIFLCGIPFMAILSILLLLSTITFSSVITVVVSLLVSLFSFIIGSFSGVLWDTFGTGTWIKIIENTPFLYVDSSFMLKENWSYLGILKVLDIHPWKGILCSFITIVISLLITIFFYKKRDIKN